MSSGLRHHIRGNVVGYAALFVALSGTAWAAGQIGSGDIAKNAVRSTHIAKGQVRKADVKPGSISSVHLTDNAVGTAELGDRTVTGVKIAESAVGAQHLADGSVFSRHIIDDAVGASELQSNSIAGGEVQNESLRGEDIEDTTVTGADVLESSLDQVPQAASAGNADRVNGAQVRTIRYRSNATNAATTVLDDLHGLTLLAACPAGNVSVIATNGANNATINSVSTDVTNGDVDNQTFEADFDATESAPIVGASTLEDDTQVGSTQYSRPEGFSSRAVSVTWQAQTGVPGFACLYTGVAIGG